MKVYEDENTLAFMDNAKDVDGHMLVIPKKHVENIFDCDSQTLCDVMKTVKKVGNHLTDHCDYDGLDFLSANDESAGQSLYHFHVHIIPRRYQDGLGGKGEWPCFPGAKLEIEEVQKRLTLEGNIVISVGLFGHSGDEEVWEKMDEGTLTRTKEILDDMHM